MSLPPDQHHLQPPPPQPALEERDIWTATPSMRMLRIHGALFATVVVIIEAICQYAAVPHLAWRIAAYAIAALIWFGRMWLLQKFEVYRLTNKYLYLETGILNKTGESIDLRRYRDLTVRKSFLQRIVGIGSIEVLSTDLSNPSLMLRDVAEPDEVARRIRTAVEVRKPAMVDVD